MAKELPYFKFEPNQWENGNIQMLSREDKGLFMDLCSMYWSRLGDVPLKLAVQKLCAGNATALNPLCDEKIIEVIECNIFIKFLSEQLNEFEDTSKQNSKNAKEGWEKRRKIKEESERNATALNPQCENDAIREDNIKENNKKESKPSLETRSIAFKETLRPFINKFGVDMVKNFYGYWSEPNQTKTKMLFEMQKTWDTSRRLETWSKRESSFNNKQEVKHNNLGI